MVFSGFSLPWADEPAPLAPSPIILPPPANPQAVSALHAEVEALLVKEAVEEVFPLYSPGCYGRIFVVPKIMGG